MKKTLDVIAWILVGLVTLLVTGLVGWGVWELGKVIFVYMQGWNLAWAVITTFLFIRTLRWAFCRVSGDPVKFWSNMGTFD